MLIYAFILLSLLTEVAALNVPRYLRRILAGAALLLYFVALGLALSSSEYLLAFLLSLIGIFRFVNAMRLSESIMHERELRTRGMQTLIGCTAAVSIALSVQLLNFDALVNVTLIMSLLISVELFVSVVISVMKYRYKSTALLSDAPSVSVCIPARNETQDLPDCIESVLAQKYHKLEIIVLDDCSHDKTPELLKKYAHDGVRFVRGREPEDKWLAKNAAYDTLLDEASGEILLFMGVDVRLQPDSVEKLVASLGDNSMLSALPQRAKSATNSLFVQPLRYWWELGLWRFISSRPPVLSSCWAARRRFLVSSGGFSAFKRTIKPETQFARRAQKADGYNFLIANNELGVESIKHPQDQLDTALRIRYPQLGRRPELALLLIVVLFIAAIAPLMLLIAGFASGNMFIMVISAISIVILACANALLVKSTLRTLWLLQLFTFPALAFIDSYIALRSMFAYERGNVVWKDRNICLPMLKVEKSLPKH